MSEYKCGLTICMYITYFGEPVAVIQDASGQEPLTVPSDGELPGAYQFDNDLKQLLCAQPRAATTAGKKAENSLVGVTSSSVPLPQKAGGKVHTCLLVPIRGRNPL